MPYVRRNYFTEPAFVLYLNTHMAYEDFKTKDSVIIVYTGEGKGKTTAALGLMVRALGSGKSVAYVQFIKHWEVGEHAFIKDVQELYGDKLILHKGGKGFYDAGEHSAKGISDRDHKQAAHDTFEFALNASSSGKYDVVICDEINNAVHDGLLSASQLEKIIDSKHEKTNLCLTGRNFPKKLLKKVDIATNMTKLKHHFDEKYLANKGIDY